MIKSFAFYPNFALYIAIGILIGTIAGTGVVYLLERNTSANQAVTGGAKVSVEQEVRPNSYLDDSCNVYLKVWVKGDRGLALEIYERESNVKCSEVESIKQAQLKKALPTINALKEKVGDTR